MRRRRRPAARVPASPGFRIALLPALGLAAYTIGVFGAGSRRGSLGMAFGAFVIALFGIGLPIDMWLDARRRRRR